MRHTRLKPDELAKRNAKFVELSAQGVESSDIADRFGVNRGQVNSIIKKHKDASDQLS